LSIVSEIVGDHMIADLVESVGFSGPAADLPVELDAVWTRLLVDAQRLP
jgi:hypothetical protein